MAVRIYRISTTIKIIVLLHPAVLGWAGIINFIEADRVLFRAGGVALLAVAIAMGIAVFTYRLTIGDNFIEAKGFRRKRIDFQDIGSVEMFGLFATVRSGKQSIQFPKDVYGFRGAISQLLKGPDRFDFEVYGDELSYKTALSCPRSARIKSIRQF